MSDTKWGGERSRQDVYGQTPDGSEASGLPGMELNERLSPYEIEIEQDKLAVGAITTFIKEGAPEVNDEVVKWAAARKLLSEVVMSGEFLLGNNDEMRRFGVVNRRVKALSEQARATGRNNQPTVRRYHRA